jgi:hypothetical protein
MAAIRSLNMGGQLSGGEIARLTGAGRIGATDQTIIAGPVLETKAVIGEFPIIEVPVHEQALASRIAVVWRCAQEVLEIMVNPES